MRAVFLDRDGTINVEKHYLYKKEDFEFLPGVIEALKMLNSAGYLLVIITNQSGIGRGYYKEEDFLSLNKWMLEELKKVGVKIDGVYYCPHLPDADIPEYRKVCDCRKPKTGLYRRACEELGISLKGSYAIGDKIRDCSICNESECKGFLIGNSEKSEVIERVKRGECPSISYSSDLYNSVCKIIGSNDYGI